MMIQWKQALEVDPIFWTKKGIENEGESMPKIRKSHPPSLKAKLAVEAIKAHKTAAQIAQMFGAGPAQSLAVSFLHSRHCSRNDGG